ncbi:MAG TPA: hypothetical protein VMT55_02830 [Candidatus Sulfotelmatobacter sp.]|nr:hypothetical protein [Candidatus Sulfotelmatobacter sp.]
MNGWIDLIKAAVRPFLIVWGAVLYSICLIKGIAVPDILAGLIAAIAVEYFGERAVLRIKESSDNNTKGES